MVAKDHVLAPLSVMSVLDTKYIGSAYQILECDFAAECGMATMILQVIISFMTIDKIFYMIPITIASVAQLILNYPSLYWPILLLLT